LEGAVEAGSNPYSLEGAVEGLLETSTMRTEAGTAVVEQSPKTKRKTPVSPTKVNVGEGVGAGGGSEERCLRELESLMAENKKASLKLVIFNIHSTLLDYSLKGERNPNSSIRYSVQTECRRVVFRPWLLQFLSKCFINFIVGFWGNKSESYMDDVLPAVLTRLKGRMKYKPLFLWSGKNREAAGFDDRDYISWDKPLRKVFENLPSYNVTNTVIVDHKGFRVGCNALGNVIITSPFYVYSLGKLGDDGNYLKASLWPLLEGFASTSKVSNFREYYPSNFLEPGARVPKLYGKLSRSEVAKDGIGKGTCKPHGSALWVSPHLLFVYSSNCVRIIVCSIKWRSGRQGRWVRLNSLKWRNGRLGQWEQGGPKQEDRRGGDKGEPCTYKLQQWIGLDCLCHSVL
jgi:hypothetical protein